MHLRASQEWHEGHTLSGSGGLAERRGGGGHSRPLPVADWFGLHHIALHQFPSSARTTFLALLCLLGEYINILSECYSAYLTTQKEIVLTSKYLF